MLRLTIRRLQENLTKKAILSIERRWWNVVKGKSSTMDTVAVHGAAKTDMGKVRTINEDAFGFFPDIAFYVVADGMGGHAGGEIASSLAVETMQTSITATKDEDLTPVLDFRGLSTIGGSRLLIALEHANSTVLAKSQETPKLAGMGTTIAAVLFDYQEAQANIVHVGDSRVYCIRDNQIELLTEDHSLFQQLVRDGKLTPEERNTFPQRHILMQAVGISPTIHPTIRVEKPEKGDLFILCSDGVHNVIDEQEILTIVGKHQGDFQQACDALLELANARGGQDNETVIILQYGNTKGVASRSS
jgi:protein phosphatase